MGNAKLTARSVAAAVNPGHYSDGGGLYFAIRETKAGNLSRRWVYRYRDGARVRDMGLGSFPDVTLAEARRRRDAARAVLVGGGNPIEDRRADVEPTESSPTFGQVASEHYKNKRDGWSEIYARQWLRELSANADSIWCLPIDQVDTEAVLRVLQPIWTAKPVVAQRVRMKIEGVVMAAISGVSCPMAI
ncbi:MAG: integrase arm-type DNA-binding domain-containing protein [Hyphomicrobiaceae bacterium]